MAGRYDSNSLEEPLLPSVVNPPRTRRLVSIDALRGAAILVMIFDHTKDFLVKYKGEDKDPSGQPYPDHSEAWAGPLQMYSNSLPYFLARFVSHFCAPAFSMLMGFGMYYLKCSRERQEWASSSILKFFLLRGALLIVLGFFTNEALVIDYLLPHPKSATPGWTVWQVVFFFQILTSLGLQMMATGALLALADALPNVEIRGKHYSASYYLSVLAAAACLLLSAVVIVSVQGPIPAIACTRPDHSRYCTQNDLTDVWGTLVRFLIIPGLVDPLKSYMQYPLLPWLPACLMGVVLAHHFKEDVKSAHENVLYLGQGALALFVIVRIAGGHGLNFRGWPLGEGMDSPLISFLNECKYPPSTAFLLLTLGFSLVLLHLLWQLDRGSHCWLRPLVVFGRSPLVFYVVHFYLVAAIAAVLSLTTGDRQVGSLLYAFPLVLGMLPILYIICLSYGRFKDRTAPDSLWRLL